jgi:hypothetical protein
VSQRLEGIEDGLDRLEQRIQGLNSAIADDRLGALEASLERIEAALTARTASGQS